MKAVIAVVALLLFGSIAQAGIIVYTANLSGPNEFPPNASPATGFAEVDLDIVAHTMRVQVTFSGLVAPSTAAHIHAPTAVPFTGTASVATLTPFFTGFPIGVTAGTYDHTFDDTLSSTWNAPFLAANGGTGVGAEAALANDLANGTAYLNIHSSTFPGGEIRGFLAAPVPEPATFVLAGAALAALMIRRRLRTAR
jgi:hypothetical protein